MFKIPKGKRGESLVKITNLNPSRLIAFSINSNFGKKDNRFWKEGFKKVFPKKKAKIQPKQPPKKKNRGQKILNSPIHEYAKKLKISVRSPISLNQKESKRHLLIRPKS